MRCPVDKSDMMVVEHERIELDYCLKCSGVWFDSGELELLLGILKAKDTSLSLDELLAPLGTRSIEKRRKCPICGRKMDKYSLGKEPGVVIDSCPQGDGLWFDSGELQRIFHETSGHTASPDLQSFLGDAFRASHEHS